jgi:hypothetical protein
MAKRGGRSGRKYVRDSIGRFATTGATARGGRLKTKSGKKRATQTVKAKTVSKPAGAIKGKIKRDPGAAKPAVAKPKLKRSGEKIGVNSLKTNKEQGRKGIVSMSSRAKAVRKGDVAERKSRRMSRIAERQSEIVARRQGRRASNYNPDGTFNQSTANANQRRLGRSKQLQEKLSYAGGGKNIASKALSKRRKPKPATAKPAVAKTAKPTAAATARKARIDGDAFAARAKKARGTELRRYINEGSRRDSLSSAQRVKTPLEVRNAASQKREAKSRSTASRAKAFYQNFGSPSTFSRRDRKSTRDSDRFGSKQRGAKKKSVTANSARAAAKPAAAKRRGAVGKISEAKAGRIVARMDAQRGRKALPGRRNANFARTAERRSQFILKPAATARNKGKRISVNESVQKAVANAAKRRKPKRRRS